MKKTRKKDSGENKLTEGETLSGARDVSEGTEAILRAADAQEMTRQGPSETAEQTGMGAVEDSEKLRAESEKPFEKVLDKVSEGQTAAAEVQSLSEDEETAYQELERYKRHSRWKKIGLAAAAIVPIVAVPIILAVKARSRHKLKLFS